MDNALSHTHTHTRTHKWTNTHTARLHRQDKGDLIHVRPNQKGKLDAALVGPPQRMWFAKEATSCCTHVSRLIILKCVCLTIGLCRVSRCLCVLVLQCLLSELVTCIFFVMQFCCCCYRAHLVVFHHVYSFGVLQKWFPSVAPHKHSNPAPCCLTQWMHCALQLFAFLYF